MATCVDISSDGQAYGPIHLPGTIQPHGVLLVLQGTAATVSEVSANTFDQLGVVPEELLGQSLLPFLQETSQQTLTKVLQAEVGQEAEGGADLQRFNPLQLLWRNPLDPSAPRRFNGIVHRSLGGVVLELEPPSTEVLPFDEIPENQQSLFRFYQLTRATLARLQNTRYVAELAQGVAEEVRRLTGFDRVMVYHFQPGGHGLVVAEAKDETIEGYRGMYFPEFDIPWQARQFYTHNYLRLIPDVGYEPVPIVGRSPAATPPPATPSAADEIAPIAASSLDMTHCTLRSVSPCHLSYLGNMGVQASMSISLFKEQRLWGLVACHHRSVHFIPYETRILCEVLGQVMSIELATRAENDDLDYRLKLKQIEGQLTEAITQADDFAQVLLKHRSALLDLVGAKGAALYADGHITSVGQTPNPDQLAELGEWLPTQLNGDSLAIDSLSQVYPPAAAYTEQASGLLAIAASRLQHQWIVWFRPEQRQTITWAGKPEAPMHQASDGSQPLFPRNSFDAWAEIVRGTAAPWRRCEIAGAVALRQAIVDILLRKTDEIAALNLELSRSNSELDSFAYIASHDLKEPLRGIHNYSTFLLEDYETLLPQEGREKLKTLIKLSHRMENLIESLLHFSRLGRQELVLRPLDLNQLVSAVLEVLDISKGEGAIEIRLPQPLPRVLGDRILIEEVLANLIGNAAKYNDQAQKWVEIGVYPPLSSVASPDQSLPTRMEPWGDFSPERQIFYVRDNGIGIHEKHQESVFRIFKRLHGHDKYGGGTGAGLTIVKKIIERHGGKIWIESTFGQGSTFYFSLPSLPTVETP